MYIQSTFHILSRQCLVDVVLRDSTKKFLRWMSEIRVQLEVFRWKLVFSLRRFIQLVLTVWVPNFGRQIKAFHWKVLKLFADRLCVLLIAKCTLWIWSSKLNQTLPIRDMSPFDALSQCHCSHWCANLEEMQSFSTSLMKFSFVPVYEEVKELANL